MALEHLVVEQDAGDDERAGERPSAGLVRSCHIPNAEPPIVSDQALSR
jgi:hypothetical protein